MSPHIRDLILHIRLYQKWRRNVWCSHACTQMTLLINKSADGHPISMNELVNSKRDRKINLSQTFDRTCWAVVCGDWYVTIFLCLHKTPVYTQCLVQRRWGKVMFYTHVNLFGGWLPSMHHRSKDREVCHGVSASGGSAFGRVCIGGGEGLLARPPRRYMG